MVMMVIYLDLCCLKRPFDDQKQPRIRLESEAVLGLQAAESNDVGFIRSPALRLENSRNPVAERASRVEQWLMASPASPLQFEELEMRSAELMRLGFRNFDALHIASAEQAGADVLATCDDQMLSAASRNRAKLKVRIVAVVELAREVLT